MSQPRWWRGVCDFGVGVCDFGVGVCDFGVQDWRGRTPRVNAFAELRWLRSCCLDRAMNTDSRQTDFQIPEV